MGLADRDYARKPPTGGGYRGGLSGARSWTFNTWLIVINVAVFVIFQVVFVSMRVPDVQIAAGGGVVPGPDLNQFTQIDAPTGQTLESVLKPGSRASTQWRDGGNRVAAEVILNQPSASLGGAVADQLTVVVVDEANRPFLQVITEERRLEMDAARAFGHFSTARIFKLEVWRFITFQFLHADHVHLIFNMIGLWFFGPLVESHLRSRKRYAAYYLTCGIFGALLYLILNLLGWLATTQLGAGNTFLLLVNDPWMPLIGASAGVFGVLMASAYIAGDDIMYVFMVIPMKIRTGAYLLTAGALINILMSSGNAGGDAAHLGGAIAGFFFIRRMDLLHDFFDILGPSKKRGPSGRTSGRRSNRDGKTEQRLDTILAKVKRDGMHSLTDEEKKFLERVSAGEE